MTGLTILFAGLFWVVSGFLGLMYFDRMRTPMGGIFVVGGYSVSVMDYAFVLTPRQLSIALLLGGATTAVGTFLLTRQFSLCRLLLSVLVTSALGVVPHFFRPAFLPPYTMEVNLGQALTPDRIEFVRTCLQPDAALATIPKAALERLNLNPTDGIARIEVAWVNGTEHASCSLEFTSALSLPKRAFLKAFYAHYFEVLMLEEAQASDAGASLAPVSNQIQGVHDGGWESVRAEWEKYRTPRNK